MPRAGVTVYDLLLSCPGDVLDLKDTIEDCVKSFNASIGVANNIRIELKHWSTDSFSQFGDKPQNILNKQFIDECDLCVALLGIRFGTPTDNYDSGTEEEIEKMLEQDKQVFLYFVERNVDPGNIDLEQYNKVKDFKQKYTDKGVYTIVKSGEELRSEFQNALSLYFIKLVSPNTTQIQPTFMPNLVISSTNDGEAKLVPVHTQYRNVKLVKDKEDVIKQLIERISSVTITLFSEKALGESKCEISDEELKNMRVGEIMRAYHNEQISELQYHRILGTKPPEYKKIEVDEEKRKLVSKFCERNDINLEDNFYYLGNLQKKIKTPIISAFGDGNISYIGSESEKEKYELFEDLFAEIMEYNHMIEYFESIDAMPCISLQIENQGNTFDEDIDVKLFIDKGCFTDFYDIPKPGTFFLEKAIDLQLPKFLFCGYHNADIEDFSNYPVSYIPHRIPLPFKSRDEEISEQREKYQEMMEHVFCYDIRENDNDDILCFNIPYLKQNTRMFFPSYLFFTKNPKNLRYEIRSKHSPEVYRGTLVIECGNETKK